MVSLTGGWELMVFRIPSLPDSQFCVFCNALSEVFWSILGEKLPAPGSQQSAMPHVKEAFPTFLTPP